MISILTLSRTPAFVESLSNALDAQDLPCPSERILLHGGSMHLTALALRRGWMVAEANAPYTFSSGNNMLAKAARGSHILLLNDDAVPAPGALAALWARRHSAQVLGSLILHTSGTVNHAGTMVDAATMRTDHIGRHADPKRWRDLAGTKHFSGPLRPAVTFAMVLIERAWWERLGGLDERYVWGWDDTDFCLRTLEAGGDIRVALDAEATHDECGTRPRNGPRDVQNYQLFHQLWAGARVGGALVGYAARHGGTVEGVL